MLIQFGTLGADYVSVKSDEYGMRAYTNSERGRAQLSADCPEELVKEVLATWGDKPTVTEPGVPDMPAPMPTETEKQLTLLAAQLKAATDRADFMEDCVAEMATQVYNT